MGPQVLLLIIITIFIIVFILKDTKKRNMSPYWAFISIFGLIGLLIYIISRKPLSNNNNTNLNNYNNPTNTINSPSSNDLINVSNCFGELYVNT